MYKKFVQSSILILIAVITAIQVNLHDASASGKMEAGLGEQVTLEVDQQQAGSSYKWVVKKGKNIVVTQVNPIFNYTFLEQGEYDVNLIVTDRLDQVKSTSIFVLVGDRYKPNSGSGGGDGSGGDGGGSGSDQPLRARYSTLPAQRPDGTIHLLGNEGRVAFDLEAQIPDVLEYRVDRNIFEDSDGNGTANDDIDNADDDSYLLAGAWETTYKAGESPKTVAEVTVVSRDGKRAKAQAEIIFDAEPDRTGDPVAILEITPQPDLRDQTVHLHYDGQSVSFYSRMSTGAISEFRIDRNVFEDSNGDGDPANDIDNLDDASFRTGDVWTTTYRKTEDQIIAQLIVVGADGKGSRVQRGIQFTEKPVQEDDDQTPDGIHLSSSNEFVMRGDPVILTVNGLSRDTADYTFEWDLEGDGLMDQLIEGDNSLTTIYDIAGVYEPVVRVTDADGNSAEFSTEVLIKEITSTTADFDFTVDGNTVSFTNLSVAAVNLSSKTLNYQWSFGDPDEDAYEAQKSQITAQSPSYTYRNPGIYLVTLTVTDADDVTDSQTLEVVISGDQVVDIPGTENEGEENRSGGSLIGKLFKILFTIILVVVLLVLLMVGGLLAFLKIQHPDLVFEELIDEMKIKILSVLGVEDMIEPIPQRPSGSAVVPPPPSGGIRIDDEPTPKPQTPMQPKPQAPAQPKPTSQPAQAQSAPKPATGPASEQPKPASSANGQQVPDWMKNPAPKANTPAKPDVIEGEVEENDAPPSGKEPLNKQDGPMPDWLKNK